MSDSSRTTASSAQVPFDPAATPEPVTREDPAVAIIFEKAAAYFSLLSEPSRLRIIQAICYSEASVQEVVQQTGLPQPNVSRHLALLHRSGVLARRRSGTSVFYRVSDPTVTEMCRLVCVRMAGGLAAA
jgi:DNA-binding transcriptional ArsR family regulator